VVELRASNADGAEGVRRLREDYPELPIVVTGALLTPRVMQELVRLGVDDVLPKPFTPGELSGAIERALRHVRSREDGAQEYAAAMGAARRAILDGRPEDAGAPLARARAAAPLDAEAMALFGLASELGGDDRASARAYRAALALADEDVLGDVRPLEGLARLEAYAGARPVRALDSTGRRTVWVVADPLAELVKGPPGGVRADVTVLAVPLVADATGAVYSRLSPDGRAWIVSTSALNERLAGRLSRAFPEARMVGEPATVDRLGSVATEGGPRHGEPDPTR
jgi:hypothetical protein